MIDDTNPEPAGLRIDCDYGHGMDIVDTLADAWASKPNVNEGKVTWFQLHATTGRAGKGPECS